jgi:hypothetical protein
MRRYAAATTALVALLSSPAAAQEAPPERTITVTVYGNDPCPDTSTSSNEIVVCARRPENDRYRIPKELRNRNEPLSETAWGSRVAGLEEESRPSMPGSCSAVGSYGQTGCRAELLRQWYAERRARKQ